MQARSCWSRVWAPMSWGQLSMLGFPCHDLNFPCSYDPSSHSLIGLPELNWCLAVDLRICFHQLLVEVLWWQLGQSLWWNLNKRSIYNLWTILFSVFWSYLLYPPTLCRSTGPFLLTQLCAFYTFFPPIKINLCCPNILGYLTFLWTRVALLGVTLLEKMFSPSPKSWQLPIATWLGVDLCVQLPSLCRDLVWTGLPQALHMLSQPLWVLMCSCPAVTWRPCHYSPPLAFLLFLPFLPQWILNPFLMKFLLESRNSS